MSTLYLIPTPIGNLEDMTFRAIRILKEVDLILAEDTRTSGVLMKHFDISTPLRAHHMHNEHATVEKLAQEMASGKTMALVTDAGTPGISDPGFLLVRACVQNGVRVESLPGPTAFVPALTVSGIPTDRFTFEGFIPPKKGRQTKFLELQTETRTMVFYESPHKLLKTLEEFTQYFGEDRMMSASREISKKFEETVRGTTREVLTHFQEHAPKGEFVLVVSGGKSEKELRKEQKANKGSR